MPGCPNGFTRPYLGKIDLVGKTPGRYKLYFGTNYAEECLNKHYRKMLNEESVLRELTPILTGCAT